MKVLLTKILVAVFLLSNVAAFAEAISDEDYTSGLVGSWENSVTTESDDGTITMQACGKYDDDGTLRVDCLITVGETAFPVYFTGTWSIADGSVTEVVETSSLEDLIPVGLSATSKIVEVTKSKYVSISEEGNESTARRCVNKKKCTETLIEETFADDDEEDEEDEE